MSTPSSAVPVTFGFEAEFDGTRTLKNVFIAIKTLLDKDGDLMTLFMAPDKYLSGFDVSKTELDAMYDVLAFEAHELLRSHGRPVGGPGFIDMILDSSTKADDGSALYLPELRTEPLDVTDVKGLLKIKDFSKIIQHFIAYIRNSDTSEITINGWIKKLITDVKQDRTWLSHHYKFQDAGLKPVAPAKKAEIVFIVPDHANFNPVIAIHVNVAVPLAKLYTVQMLTAFPPVTSYPPKVSPSLEWPSCGIPDAHMIWAKQLITDTELCVDRYLSIFLPAHINPLHKANIAGVFRTLVYCYIVEVYILSDLCKLHFPEDIYTHDSPKDFYLLGLPKFNLGTLIDQLSDPEKDLIRTYLLRKIPEVSGYKLPGSVASKLDPQIMIPDIRTVTSIFSCVAPELMLTTSKGSFYNSATEQNRFLSLKDYIDATLISPLYTDDTNYVSLVVKILDPLVIEFRAAVGHGCYAHQLPAVLDRHIKAVASLRIGSPGEPRARETLATYSKGSSMEAKRSPNPFRDWGFFVRGHLEKATASAAMPSEIVAKLDALALRPLLSLPQSRAATSKFKIKSQPQRRIIHQVEDEDKSTEDSTPISTNPHLTKTRRMMTDT